MPALARMVLSRGGADALFVTGAMGFIGKRLVKRLLVHKGAVVHYLLRPQNAAKATQLRQFWGVSAARVRLVAGDLTRSQLRLSAAQIKPLKSQIAANIEGTRYAAALAQAIEARHFHHASSIAAAGLYQGVFREDMFEQAQHCEHLYFKTKHGAEKIVRQECTVPWTVYWPGVVVGDSLTGEMDKVDGPYYFFKLIQRTRQWLTPCSVCCPLATTQPTLSAGRPWLRCRTAACLHPVKDHARRLWDYWERHLDPDLHAARSPRGTVAGKVVLITGGSSGIGLAAAHQFAAAGATTTDLRFRCRQTGASLPAGARTRLPVCGLPGGPGRPGRLRPFRCPTDPRAWRGGPLDQQCRPVYPPRHCRQLRPVSLFRAHHIAQLLWQPAPYPGPAARHGGQ